MDPGRNCPLHYQYSPEALNRAPALVTETLYAVGGLYGNVEALNALEPLLAREGRRTQVVFNGDFNWFDVDGCDFEAINRQVLGHTAIQGNVEAELADPSAGTGCGCAYPESVDAAVVERSNQIMARLQQTAAAFPAIRNRLNQLPMHLTAAVGGLRVGIVHGDCHSLAGWAFDEANLPGTEDTIGAAAIAEQMNRANCRIIACSHTCLPCAQDYDVDDRTYAVINNGAAGMPNFEADLRGVVTRISVHPPAVPTLYGYAFADVYVSAVPLSFDTAAWQRRFLGQWPPGSPAHASYFSRITQGPGFSSTRAARGRFRRILARHSGIP